MRRGLALVSFAAAFLIAAGVAQASFHLMKIREVGNANPVDYVELQMYAGGQNFVGGHFIQTYASNGDALSTYAIPHDVANGQSQRTILFAGAGSPPVTPDFSAGPDLDVPEDGAVCFLATAAPPSAIDCVSFGTFAGATPSPTGTNVPALAPGTSIHRTIAPGCSTLLEPSDDTDDSATDFAVGPPTPRNNSMAPTEKACVVPDTKAPNTEITKEPKKRTSKAKVTIAFRSTESGSTFECKLDKGSFEPCDSPFVDRVGKGKHKFQVAATDRAGNADASPAVVKFRRVAKKKG
jgi:hypothetical protein